MRMAATEASEDKRTQLRSVLNEFWHSADSIFALSIQGKEAEARALIQSDLEPQRAIITETVSRLLILNDRAQVSAAEQIVEIYGEVKREVLLLIGVLVLILLLFAQLIRSRSHLGIGDSQGTTIPNGTPFVVVPSQTNVNAI